MRDWTTTLFAAAYKGVGFYTKSTSGSGGRRLVVTELPYRDDPFIEDLGASKRNFDVSAYFASDQCDIDAAAMTAACDSADAGLLILPDQGPIEAWCLTFQRRAERDRAGYIAYSMTFVRAGAAASLISVGSLAQGIFNAAESALTALGNRANAGLQSLGQPAQVVNAAQAAVADLADSVATLQSIVACDPQINVAVTQALANVLSALPGAITRRGFDTTQIPAVLTAADTFSSGADVAALWPMAQQMMDAALPPAPVSGTPNAQAAANNATQSAALVRGLALVLMGQALAAVPFATRRDATNAKFAFAERVSFELGRCQGAPDADWQSALMGLRGAVTDYISASMTNLAPIVTVQAAKPMPAMWWAWRLYGDPARAAELIARNDVAMPCALPLQFEALAI